MSTSSGGDKEPRRRIGFGRGILVGALAAALTVHFDSGLHDVIAQPRVTTTSPNPGQKGQSQSGQEGYSKVPYAPSYKYKSISEFRGAKPNNGLATLVAGSTLELKILSPNGSYAQCTASFFNDYVLTAGHCLAAQKSNEVIEINDTQGNKIGTLGKTTFYDNDGGADIGMGLPQLPLNHEGVLQNQLSNSMPQSGEVFDTTQLPGGHEVKGSLLFLGGNTYQQQLVTDPANGNAVDKALCTPGASGSLVLSEYSVAVTDTDYEDQNQPTSDQEFGLNLPASPYTHNCGVTVLTASLYSQMVASLK